MRNELLIPSRTLWHVGWRYLVGHGWQALLMIVGITLGVAVVVAIDLANASASRAFDLSTDAVAGRATHQIVGGPQGIDETLYLDLRRAGKLPVAAPIVTEYVSSASLGDRPIQLLGVDPFAEAPFRDYLAGQTDAQGADLSRFLTEPDAVLISSEVAKRFDLESGEHIVLDVGGDGREVTLVGLLEPTDALTRRALDGIILADIATAQELTNRVGSLDRIDLIEPQDDEAFLETLSGNLPADVRILPVSARSGAIKQMTAAFRTNLTALSLLALVVGMLLIYNTMTFSVVQRRPLFGTLRCLGVTRSEVFLMVIGEAFLIGVIGAVLGLALGVVMGQAAVRLVTQTINDLYFVVNVTGLQVPAGSLIKGALLAVLATMFSAAPPAREAASVPPRAALSRSGLESKVLQVVGWVALGGVVMLAGGFGLLALPTRSLVISFASTCAVVIGFAMLAPLATRLFMRLAIPWTGRFWGVLGRMAPRNVVNSLSRTSIAVAALMVAVSVTIGVSLMIGSFRHTVVLWLAQTLQGDVYILAPGLGSISQAATTIRPDIVAEVESWPGVARVDKLRTVSVDSPAGLLQIDAVTNPAYGRERTYLVGSAPAERIWPAMEEGAIVVSEPLALRLRLPQRGGSIQLYTDTGEHTFPVVGIYHDYGSPQGAISMSLGTYRRWWNDVETVTAVAIRLLPGVDADGVAHAYEDAFSSRQRLFIRPNRALRDDVLVIFDRTFAITNALQLLATVVAFIGVLSALLSLQLDKQREFGILRAVGLTGQQLWGLVALETSLMGSVAGLLAMPTGYVLSLILIYVINRRAFGWTLQMLVEPTPFLRALAIAVGAAVLAGIYPALRMNRMLTAEALRSE